MLTPAVLQAVVEAQAWSFIEEEPTTFQQLTQQLIAQTKPSLQQKGTLRSPFVTILGHVDHGKTTLLEQLCQMSVCPNEPGNITQHIGVYEVLLQPPSAGRVIFIDTPGHALFTKMRLHGTNATDIALLVVSAVDGVQPQTIESINHARAANIKVIVFINKMDLPNANPTLVMQQLTRYGLIAEARGGDTMMLSGSALRNEGIIPLVEAISLLGEVLDLRALLSTPASGVVLESYHNVQQGYVAILLIHNGTLKVRDYLMAGHVVGRVRAIYNNKKKQVRQMTAGNAVTVTGLPTLPKAGEPFIVLQDVKMAQLLTKYLVAEQKKQRQQTKVNINFDALLLTEAEKQSQKAHLNLVVKADTANTLQALTAMIDNLKLTHKTLQVVHAGVGNLNESDLLLAVASNASLIGFNVQTTTGFNNLNKTHQKAV